MREEGTRGISSSDSTRIGATNSKRVKLKQALM
jgi:hypothetical protein